MYKIIDFSSVWEIGFAVNVLFVIFELEPYLEKRFRTIQILGKDWIKMVVVNESDQNFVQRYGWRNLGVYYVVWSRRLKKLSVINSILALALLIFVGFNPNAELGIFSFISILLLIFSTLIGSFYVIIYGLPKFKLKCINEALNAILEQEKKSIPEKGNLDVYQSIEKKYKALVKLIEFTEVNMPSPFYYKSSKYVKKAFEDMEFIINNKNNF